MWIATVRLVVSVTIQRGAEIINSVVRGPSIIGENTRIINSYIGPYTSIDHDVTIENSEVEHSMVLENSQILDIEITHPRQFNWTQYRC